MISKEGNGIHLNMKGKRHKGKKIPSNTLVTRRV